MFGSFFSIYISWCSYNRENWFEDNMHKSAKCACFCVPRLQRTFAWTIARLTVLDALFLTLSSFSWMGWVLSSSLTYEPIEKSVSLLEEITYWSVIIKVKIIRFGALVLTKYQTKKTSDDLLASWKTIGNHTSIAKLHLDRIISIGLQPIFVKYYLKLHRSKTFCFRFVTNHETYQ